MYSICMKITLNIDRELLARVVDITGSETKTEAIHFALKEVDRRARLVEVLRAGTGASAKELRGMFDAESDPLAMRVAEKSGTSYGAKE
jgi:Arc/MetJ family transcription regulator